MAEYNFQKELESSIFNRDPRINPDELLVQIFKTYVAKMFEHILGKKQQNRIEHDGVISIKRNLINEFRQAALSEYQKSVEWYENLFNKTVEEIFNEAALAHEGVDSYERESNLEINKSAYEHESGLILPGHMRPS